MAFDGSTWPGPKPGAKVAPPFSPFKPKPKKGPGYKPAKQPDKPGKRYAPKRPPPAPKWKQPTAPKVFPPTAPKVFGPPTRPKAVPFGKKVPLTGPIVRPGYRWLPRPPGWADLFIDIGEDLLFQQPDWVYDPGAGWTKVQTCGRNPLYNEGQAFTVAKGCTSLGCLTAQASPAPGYYTCQPGCLCTGGVPCYRLRVDDLRFLGPPVNAWRAHYRAQYIWNCPAVGNPGPTRPSTTVVYPRFQDEGAPDPWAQQPPGKPMPAPIPTPYRWLPKVKDPNTWLDPSTPPQERPATRPGAVVVPAPVPGGGTVVLPFPPGWNDPAPLPGVYPGPVPAPIVLPTPQPGTPTPWPNLPGTPPYVVPGPGVGTIVGPGPQPPRQIRTRTHARVRPKANTRETKYKAPAWFSLLWRLFGAGTESLDAIDVAYKSIPCSEKQKAGLMGRRINPMDKALFVAANMRKINSTELYRNYLKNQFEDWFYGTLSKGQKWAHQKYHEVSGADRFAQVSGQYQGKFTRKAEERAKVKGGNPVVDRMNEFIDMALGATPEEFSCCAGKRVRCGTRKSQALMRKG